MPYSDQLSNDAREGLLEVVNALGARVEKIDATASFSGLVEAQNIIQYYEIARNLADVRANHREKLSPQISKLLDHGSTVSDEAYTQALELRSGAINYFSSFFNDFDAIITPAAAGEAPLYSEGITGNPIFSTVWTLCGLPCLTLPLLVSENNLPIGVQIVGAQEEDDRLMRTAAWLLQELNSGK
jgi:Asp-tRNA(Asn)/Glu-tRNA(Gln) amidotransferase A subunit family amidase